VEGWRGGEMEGYRNEGIERWSGGMKELWRDGRTNDSEKESGNRPMNKSEDEERAALGLSLSYGIDRLWL